MATTEQKEQFIRLIEAAGLECKLTEDDFIDGLAAVMAMQIASTQNFSYVMAKLSALPLKISAAKAKIILPHM
jgi:aromatic ring hydroxylase